MCVCIFFCICLWQKTPNILAHTNGTKTGKRGGTETSAKRGQSFPFCLGSWRECQFISRVPPDCGLAFHFQWGRWTWVGVWTTRTFYIFYDGKKRPRSAFRFLYILWLWCLRFTDIACPSPHLFAESIVWIYYNVHAGAVATTPTTVY